MNILTKVNPVRILKDVRNLFCPFSTDSDKLEALNKVLVAKQHELVQLAKNNEDYSALAGEIDDLRAQKQKILVEKARTEGYKSRIQELGELLKKDRAELTKYDEGMVRNYIKGIKIFEDKFTVSFKAGIDIDIPR